jgi:hypothetical protein
VSEPFDHSPCRGVQRKTRCYLARSVGGLRFGRGRGRGIGLGVPCVSVRGGRGSRLMMRPAGDWYGGRLFGVCWLGTTWSKASLPVAWGTMPKLDRSAVRLGWSKSPQLDPPKRVGGKHNLPALRLTSVAVLPRPAGQVLELEEAAAKLAHPRQESHICRLSSFDIMTRPERETWWTSVYTACWTLDDHR